MEEAISLIQTILFIVIIAISLLCAIAPLIIVFGANLLKKSRAHRIAGRIIIATSAIAIASFVIGIIATFTIPSGIALILGLVSASIISWGGAIIAWIAYLFMPKDLSAKNEKYDRNI